MAQNNGTGVGTTPTKTQDFLHIIIEKEMKSISSKPRNALQSAIFPVPPHFREGNESCYEPRSVSIGPYHHGHRELRMASIKVQYLRDFLARSSRRDLQSYLSVLTKLETKARDRYINSDAINGMSSEDFTKMLLLDGCFVLECALKRYDNKFDRIGPISRAVISDLLLLENQIPFFVLVTLYDALILPAANKPSLVYILASYLIPETSADRYVSRSSSLMDYVTNYVAEEREIYHLLHLFHICFVREPERNECNQICHTYFIRSFTRLKTTTFQPTDNDTASSNTAPHNSSDQQQKMNRHPVIKRIPCASELVESGITFKRSAADFLDVSFRRNGVLNMPYLSIGDCTKSWFMNLLAFEQIGGASKFTSYAIFMDSIIDTAKDVALLQQSGVIDNKLGTDKEAALLFNQLSSYCHIDLEKHSLADLFGKVDKYCQSNWRKHKVRLYRDYFSSPWSIISLLAAALLLALTFTQTYYTVRGPNQSPSPPSAPPPPS